MDDWRVVKRSRARHAVDATFPLAVPKARPHASRKIPYFMFCPTNNAKKTYTSDDDAMMSQEGGEPSSPFKNPTHASDSIVLSSMWTTVQGPPSSKKNSNRRATRAP